MTLRTGCFISASNIKNMSKKVLWAIEKWFLRKLQVSECLKNVLFWILTHFNDKWDHSGSSKWAFVVLVEHLKWFLWSI